jgi:uncharacterized membrane protein YgcG
MRRRDPPSEVAKMSVTKPTRRLLPLLSLSIAMLASQGCGPFGYLKKVAKDATRAVADAEKAGAEKYAPYEYWGAVAYLEQAKVMMAYSEYERSFDYGSRAKQLAEEAKQKAQRREAGQMQETAAPPATDEPATDAPPPASGDADASGDAGSGSASGKIEVGGSVGGGGGDK